MRQDYDSVICAKSGVLMVIFFKRLGGYWGVIHVFLLKKTQILSNSVSLLLPVPTVGNNFSHLCPSNDDDGHAE